MVDLTSLKRYSTLSVAMILVALGSARAQAQTVDNARVNQDELASFFGRMNVVVGSGARAFGMGGAFLARADDATAASWNPSGLSYLRRTEFSFVGVHNDFVQKVPKFGEGHVIYTKDQLRASVVDFAGVGLPSARVGPDRGHPGVLPEKLLVFGIPPKRGRGWIERFHCGRSL